MAHITWLNLYSVFLRGLLLICIHHIEPLAQDLNYHPAFDFMNIEVKALPPKYGIPKLYPIVSKMFWLPRDSFAIYLECGTLVPDESHKITHVVSQLNG